MEQVKAKVTLVIALLEDGKIGVQGPLQDKILCYGLLGVAQDVIRAHKPEPPTGIVGVPPGSRVLPR